MKEVEIGNFRIDGSLFNWKPCAASIETPLPEWGYSGFSRTASVSLTWLVLAPNSRFKANLVRQGMKVG
jgi:hypothetical protein